MGLRVFKDDDHEPTTEAQDMGALRPRAPRRSGDDDCGAVVRVDVLQMWPASKRVNSSRADGDDATLIEQEVLKRSGSVVRCSVGPSQISHFSVECFKALLRQARADP